MAIKVKGILPDDQDVQQLKDDKVMNQPTREEGGNEHHELIENCRETGDGEDLCCDQGHDSNWSGPQGCAKEFHGNFKDHCKEGDDHSGFIAHLTKNGSKDKAEENNPQSVGSWTTTKDSKDFWFGIRICGVFWSLFVSGECLLVRGLDDVVCNYIPGRRERHLKKVLLSVIILKMQSLTSRGPLNCPVLSWFFAESLPHVKSQCCCSLAGRLAPEMFQLSP